MSKTQNFEDIFKSDTHTCEHCGNEIAKGGNKKKGKGAKAVGNEMAPHKGPASGQVKSPQVGIHKTGKVQRDAVQPKNPTVTKKGGEEPDLNKAMFPVNAAPQLAVYAGLAEDNALSKSIEQNLKPGAGTESGLFTPPARNLAMEQESERISKASKSDDDSSDETGDDDSSSDDGTDDDGSTSET